MPPRRAAIVPRLVVDVGNTRIKWGLCDAAKLIKAVSLPPDDPTSWQSQLHDWRLQGRLDWTLSGVHPERRARLGEWIKERGDNIDLITSPKQLPLKVALPQPAKVGIDRLLNAVAVKFHRSGNMPAVIVDAGTAVTVDLLDARGVFRGGAILPGFRLMAKALHDYTALLPLIEVNSEIEVPATSTVQAMNAGIYCAVLGGIHSLIKQMVERQKIPEGYDIVFTGGDALELYCRLAKGTIMFPNMTLEGLRIAAFSGMRK